MNFRLSIAKWKDGEMTFGSGSWESSGTKAVAEVTKTLQKIEKARSGADNALLRLKNAVGGVLSDWCDDDKTGGSVVPLCCCG